ncbi:hypothetical protein FB451DRAFT_1189608 [Mycena latifolia]|nr:hypothetical protein FB451DRAFT_1189608 [Mycena latifolia]
MKEKSARRTPGDPQEGHYKERSYDDTPRHHVERRRAARPGCPSAIRAPLGLPCHSRNKEARRRPDSEAHRRPEGESKEGKAKGAPHPPLWHTTRRGNALPRASVCADSGRPQILTDSLSYTHSLAGGAATDINSHPNGPEYTCADAPAATKICNPGAAFGGSRWEKPSSLSRTKARFSRAVEEGGGEGRGEGEPYVRGEEGGGGGVFVLAIPVRAAALARAPHKLPPPFHSSQKSTGHPVRCAGAFSTSSCATRSASADVSSAWCCSLRAEAYASFCRKLTRQNTTYSPCKKDATMQGRTGNHATAPRRLDSSSISGCTALSLKLESAAAGMVSIVSRPCVAEAGRIKLALFGLWSAGGCVRPFPARVVGEAVVVVAAEFGGLEG